MLDLDLCPHQNVHDHSAEPGFYGSTSVNEEITSKSILKYIGLIERSHHPLTTASGDNSTEVGACGVIGLTFSHVEFASWSYALWLSHLILSASLF